MDDCLIYEYRPGSLYVNLTNACTNSCIFCSRTYSSYLLGGFDLFLSNEHGAEEYIDNLKRSISGHSLIREIVFCGYGEPTSRLGALLEIAAWSKERGFPVRLNTNGLAEMIHERDVVFELIGLIDGVNVSLNAPDPHSYAGISNPEGGEDVWRCVLGFLRRCLHYLPETWASVVGDTLSPEELSATRALCSNLGAILHVR